MADDKKPEGEQKPRITLDPSKFSINADGQVIINDPALAESLRAAANEEPNDPGHGVTVGVVVSF